MYTNKVEYGILTFFTKDQCYTLTVQDFQQLGHLIYIVTACQHVVYDPVGC